MNCKNLLLILIITFFMLIEPGFTQVKFTKILIDTSFAENSWPFDLNAADLNGDSEIDLVVSCQDVYTGENSVFLWYQNDGSENFVKNIIETPIFEVRTCDIADLDGDLDNDIILAASNRLFLYDNDGIGNFQKIIIDDELWHPNVPIIVDLDDDLDNDIVFLNHQGIFWEINDGSQNFTRDTIDVVTSYDMGLYVADLDDDSNNDVVAQFHIPMDMLVWYRNDGYENFTREPIDSSVQSVRQIIVDDLDEDSDQDVIVIAGDIIFWYKNDGHENFIRDTISVNFNQLPKSMAIADIDSDGDKDVLVVGGNSLIGEVVLYENDGDVNFIKYTIDNNPGNRQRIFVVDIEQDGDFDLFVTNNFPFEIVYYRNDGITKVKKEPKLNLPSVFALKQNYPNPFNPITFIEYELPEPAYVEISVYNFLGQKITTLVKKWHAAGLYSTQWEVNQLSSGIYFYRIEAGKFIQTKKCLLLK